MLLGRHIYKLFSLVFCSEAKTRKAVTYNYACMLVLLVVQSSNELQMMEQYAAPLLSLAKADETNAKLQGSYYVTFKMIMNIVFGRVCLFLLNRFEPFF